jgi:hypothetical protein
MTLCLCGTANRVPAFACLVGALICAGCTGEKKFCVDGLDLGTTYQVTVLEPANAQSQYAVQTDHGLDFGIGTSINGLPTCGSGFDLVAGSAFSVTPFSSQGYVDCYGRIAVPSEVIEIHLAGPTNYLASASRLMVTTPFEADHGGGCIGLWELQFIPHVQDSPLKTPIPGDYPPVILLRSFRPYPTTDPQSCLLLDSKLVSRGWGYCSDYFVVKLEKT